MSTVYLIRHGKTEANLQHLYCGSTDLPLSDTGIAELKGLKYAIQTVRFITSGMKRTEETLHVLFGDVPFEVEPAFREVDFGVFEMHSYDDLKDRADYQEWITGDNESKVPPDGESGKQMTQRVLRAFSSVKDAQQDVAIITHGGVIAAIMESLFPAEGKNRYQWQPKPGYGYAIENGRYFSIP